MPTIHSSNTIDIHRIEGGRYVSSVYGLCYIYHSFIHFRSCVWLIRSCKCYCCWWSKASGTITICESCEYLNCFCEQRTSYTCTFKHTHTNTLLPPDSGTVSMCTRALFKSYKNSIQIYYSCKVVETFPFRIDMYVESKTAHAIFTATAHCVSIMSVSRWRGLGASLSLTLTHPFT